MFRSKLPLLSLTLIWSLNVLALETFKPAIIGDSATVCVLRAFIRDDPNAFLDCSATLIEGNSQYDILTTSAHCRRSFENYDSSYEFAYSCDYSGYKGPKKINWKILDVKAIEKHPQYTRPEDEFDIARIVIPKVPGRTYVRVAASQSEHDLLTKSSNCLVAGFGPYRVRTLPNVVAAYFGAKEEKKPLVRDVLGAGYVQFVSPSVLANDKKINDPMALPQSNFPGILIYTYHTTSLRGTDSGGPVLCPDSKGKLVLVGISTSGFTTDDQLELLNKNFMDPNAENIYSTALPTFRHRKFLLTGSP